MKKIKYKVVLTVAVAEALLEIGKDAPAAHIK